MSKSKKIMLSLTTLLVSFANFSLFCVANSATSVWGYQPKEPEGLKRYKR